MNDWRRSEHETASLRETIDCPPESCVFRRKDLVALVYCDDHAWHLFLVAVKGKRVPGLGEMIEAREALLPGIEDFAVTYAKEFAIPVLHLVELREPGSIRRELLQ